MSWRTGNRRQRDQEKPFVKDWKNESLKEGGSSLVQQAGIALGALAAVVASRLGLPTPMAVVVASVTATAVAIVGKGYVAAVVNAIDRRRERRRRSGGGWAMLPGLPAADNATPLMATARGASGATGERSGLGVGGVVSAIGEVMSQLEQAEKQLTQTAQLMRTSQESLTLLLRGGRGEQVNRQVLIAARSHVRDCGQLIQRANEDLRHYLRAI